VKLIPCRLPHSHHPFEHIEVALISNYLRRVYYSADVEVHPSSDDDPNSDVGASVYSRFGLADSPCRPRFRSSQIGDIRRVCPRQLW
jgi:hypothetical protein